MTVRNASTPKPDVRTRALTSSSAPRQPLIAYAVLLALGVAPTLFVTQHYGVLPNRLVVQWDMFGNLTFIGTRARSVLMVANAAALIAFTSVAVAIWQNKALVALGLRRAYVAASLAQVVAINLTCGMIVTDALGYGLTLKPTIPPAMAVLVFACGMLVWRLDQGASRLARGVAIVLLAGGPALLAFSAIAAGAVVGYYASAFALLAMVAIVLPAKA